MSPSAATGRHVAAGNADTSVIRSTVCAVAPARSVTVCSGAEWSRRAALPSWWPAASAETPGKPNRWHAWPETFVSSIG